MANPQKIYSACRPMKVFWMFSGGASSLKATFDDSNNGTLYTNVGAYADKEDAKGRQLCRDEGVREFFVSRRDFYSQHQLNPRDRDSRRKFYDALGERIDKEFNPDIICLSGYMHIVSDPLLGYRPILNIHPADLAILSGPTVSRLDASQLLLAQAKEFSRARGLSRKFRGENAVYDAVAASERSTRSTLHMATEVFDEGPIVVQSKPFYVEPDVHEKTLRGCLDGVPEYAAALQDKMKMQGDGPAYLKALELISRGRLSMDGETIFLDGSELPYCGLRLG